MQEIILGNAYELIKKIGDNTIDCIITDPPYEINTKQGGGAFGVEKKLNYGQLKYIADGFDYAILDDFVRVLKKINIYIFCSRKQIIPLLKYFVIDRGCNWTPISWHKDNPVPACNNKYVSDTEYCLFFRDKGVQLYGTAETKRTYYVTHTNIKDKREYGHPTPKPQHIIENFIINSTLEGDLILDPFSGSGTTAVSCKKLKRNCIAFELKKEHFITSTERLEATTALKVKRVTSSQTTLF